MDGIGDHGAGVSQNARCQLENGQGQVAENSHHRDPHCQCFFLISVHKCYLLNGKDSSYGTHHLNSL